MCSETVKFGHVTFVWNGNRSGQFSNTLEKYVEIPSDSGISFNEKPEMKAIAIAEKASEALRSGKWDQVLFLFLVIQSGLFLSLDFSGVIHDFKKVRIKSSDP